MQITIIGANKKLSSAIKDAALFYSSILLDPRMAKNIVLDIELHNKLSANGECYPEDDTLNPRWFTINMRKKSDEPILKTLAHEMVHLKQFAKNELRAKFVASSGNDSAKQIVLWKNEEWKPNKKQHHYWDAPYEIEAYGMEVGLYYKYVTRDRARK